MTKNKTITHSEILNFYITHKLENGDKPSSVYAFCKKNKFEESQFYIHFGSFEAIEKSIFKAFFENTQEALEKNKEYPQFDARNKLLSFYFTFFENLTANRSFVLTILEENKTDLKKLKVLSELKNSFTNYIASLEIETIDFKQKNISQIQEKSIKESAWVQFLITLKFWMNDTSASFEKTDIFIEKSVNTSFDLINTAPLKSLIDFGKFLYKEKMNLN